MCKGCSNSALGGGWGRGLIAAPFRQAVTKLRGRVFEEEIEWESMLRDRILLGEG